MTTGAPTATDSNDSARPGEPTYERPEIPAGYEGVLLTVAYDGSAFHGWAPQRNALSVAEVLLKAVQRIRVGVVALRGASRTDTGVHSRGQRVSFDAAPGVTTRGWVLGLTTFLPPTVSVRSASRVEAGFDPRYHGRGKRYIYTLLADRLRDPLLEPKAWRVTSRIDPERMREAARTLLGTHDFKAFRAAADARTDTIRTLNRVDVQVDPVDPRIIRVVVDGDRFLYHMVRIITGTLGDIGAGRRPVSSFADAFATNSRERLGQTAPALGLLLDEVRLDDEGTDPWPPVASSSASSSPPISVPGITTSDVASPVVSDDDD